MFKILNRQSNRLTEPIYSRHTNKQTVSAIMDCKSKNSVIRLILLFFGRAVFFLHEKLFNGHCFILFTTSFVVCFYSPLSSRIKNKDPSLTKRKLNFKEKEKITNQENCFVNSIRIPFGGKKSLSTCMKIVYKHMYT